MLIGAALSCFVVSYMAILHEGIYMNFQNCLDTREIMCYCNKKFNTSNRWSGDNGNDAFTESLGCWEPDEKQVVKWTAEGAVKCKVYIYRVFCNVWAYVSCRGYVCILLRARRFREFKVAPRIVSYLLYMYTIRPWQKLSFCQGRFFVV